MKFSTDSGSIYEIDFWEKKIRRASGHASGNIDLKDDEWRRYHEIIIPVVGWPFWIVWDHQLTMTTRTSPVKEILEMGERDRSFFLSFVTAVGNVPASC